MRLVYPSFANTNFANMTKSWTKLFFLKHLGLLEHFLPPFNPILPAMVTTDHERSRSLPKCMLCGSNLLNIGLVHTYPDNFKSGAFFYGSTRRAFELFSPILAKTLERWKYDSIPCVERCMTSSYSKTSVFICPHNNGKLAFSKHSTLRTAFKVRVSVE